LYGNFTDLSGHFLIVFLEIIPVQCTDSFTK
jgi:hypothetical protein